MSEARVEAAARAIHAYRDFGRDFDSDDARRIAEAALAAADEAESMVSQRVADEVIEAYADQQDRAERAAKELEAKLRDCEAALRESHGSYLSLIAVTGREDAKNWDGPLCAQDYFERGKVGP